MPIGSHYISRLLTKPWEDQHRHLHVYDFGTKQILVKPSVDHFVVEDLHTKETEQRLSRHVEDAIGKYKKRCQKADGALVELDARAHRALFAMLIFQIQRTDEAKGETKPGITLDQMLADEPDRMIDHAIHVFSEKGALVGIQLRVDELCFPSVGFFAIPILGHPPAFAMPLSPASLVALVAHGVEDAALQRFGGIPICALSAATRGLTDQIVVPPSLHGLSKGTLGYRIRSMRKRGTAIMNRVGEQALARGLPAFGYVLPGLDEKKA